MQQPRARPGVRPVHQVDHPGPRQHHPAALRVLAQEAQLGCLDAAQRQLLLVGEGEPGPLQVDRVPEPPVVQPHPALAPEPLDARPARGSAAAQQRAADARRGQIQSAPDGQLGRVQREPRVRVDQPGAPQAQRHADAGAAQTQFTVRLQHLGLEVLADADAVRGDGAAAAVAVDDGLVEQQIRADLGVGEPDAVVETAPRQMEIALGVHAGGLQARHGAVHQPYGREVGLRQPDLPVEAAAAHLDVRHHRAAREVHRVADPYADELERRHAASEGGRAVQQQPADDPRADGAFVSPGMSAVRIVDDAVAAAQVVHAAVAEGLPHAEFGRGQVVRQVVRQVSVAEAGTFCHVSPIPLIYSWVRTTVHARCVTPRTLDVKGIFRVPAAPRISHWNARTTRDPGLRELHPCCNIPSWPESICAATPSPRAPPCATCCPEPTSTFRPPWRRCGRSARPCIIGATRR